MLNSKKNNNSLSNDTLRLKELLAQSHFYGIEKKTVEMLKNVKAITNQWKWKGNGKREEINLNNELENKKNRNKKDGFDLEKNPEKIQIGKFEITSWYSAPFPQEFANIKKLYICEYCLKYMKTEDVKY